MATTMKEILVYVEDERSCHVWNVIDPDMVDVEDGYCWDNGVVDTVNEDEYLTLADEENGIVDWTVKYEQENDVQLVSYDEWQLMTDPVEARDWDSECHIREGR